jgi:hypothetical protein
VKRLTPFVFLFLAIACDSSNTSNTSADYETVRVKQLALTDSSGKTVVMVTGERNRSGSPVIVLKDANGTVLKTIEITSGK